MQPVAFYAINGIGLGHIARLSVIQRHLAELLPDLPIHAYCRSEWGSSFFSCPCTYVPSRDDLKNELGIRGVRGHFNILQARLFPSRRKTFFFDTYWPERVVKRLKSGGHRLILVMESFKPEDMFETLTRAVEDFAHIFFPCEQEELEYHYRDHVELWELMETGCCEAVGPFVRRSNRRDVGEKVIFTLGGGGDHANEDNNYSVQACLNEYVCAAQILHDAGKEELYLAKGPLMTEEIELGHLQELETMNLPDFFGENTCVVTRGTYNLSWETIAAGAKLVTCGRRVSSKELADGRNNYLAHKQYAYCAALNGEALATAILKDMPSAVEVATEIVNERAGLERILNIVQS